MCLRIRYGRPLRPDGLGYKILEKESGGKLVSPCKKVSHEHWFEGKWKTAIDGEPCRDIRDYGEIGFHIYIDRLDAERALLRHSFPENLVIRRVVYDEATLQGLGDGGWNEMAHVVVAQRAMLIPEFNEEKK